MTKKERQAIQRVCKMIDEIYCFHNKNLTKDQYYKLDECLELLKSIGVKIW